jgi:predicted Zn-dependent peptidase
VGRPRLDAEELDRERGVVIQEINRAYDQPSTVAEYLIDRAAFGDHPLGRTVLGPEENLSSFTREGIVAFRERRWAGASGGAFLAGNLDHLPEEQEQPIATIRSIGTRARGPTRRSPRAP